MDLGLRGKVALVAASSQGLGRAIAEELAAEHASLVLCARGAEALERARAEIHEAHGGDVTAIAADVSKVDDIERLVSRALAAHGHVDILVTNAGGPPSGQFDDLSPAAWQGAFELTLRSTVELARRVLPGMRERRWGRIINVTSIAVKQPVDRLMLSNSLRSAVTGFARTLANEVASAGITVNNVMPGFTRTERLEALARATAEASGGTLQDAYDRWAAETPAARIGEPRELAALAAFLASDRASYITGQSIAVDGGWIRSLI